MSASNINIAEHYYEAMNNKDLNKIALYLHPKVEFLGPLAQLEGKEAVLESAKGFLGIVDSVKMRVKFASGNQVMLAYDLNCVSPIGTIRVAALMTFEDNLISSIELFFDARVFDKK
jgi:hypothetical protein